MGERIGRQIRREERERGNNFHFKRKKRLKEKKRIKRLEMMMTMKYDNDLFYWVYILRSKTVRSKIFMSKVLMSKCYFRK